MTSSRKTNQDSNFGLWLWAIYSHSYDGLLKFWPYDHLLELMVEETGPIDGLHILDLGCGTGNLIDRLEKQNNNFSAVGVDFSPSMLKVAHRKLSKLEKTGKLSLVKMDGLEFLKKQPDASFDRILSMNVIYAINDQAGLWDELVRVLKPSGRIIATTSVRTGSGPIIREHIRNASVWSLIKPQLLGVFVVDALINFFGDTGKYAFSTEADLRQSVAQAGGKWGQTAICYGGETEGVNILFSVTR